MKYIYLIVASLFLFSVTAFAQVPRTISYQGILTDASGNLLPDGNTTLTVKLYPDAAGGSSIYSETQTVAVVKGRYNMIIGSVTPVPDNLSFSKAYFLGVSVGADAELTPRTALTAAPYALRAAIADAVSPNAAGVVTTLNNLSGAIKLQGGGGTTITPGTGIITISSNGTGGSGIQGIQSGDGSIDVLAGSGPNADVRLAGSAILTKHIADGAVTSAKINATDGNTGQVLTSNGFGVASWRDVNSAGSIILPYADTVNAAFAAMQLYNSGPGIAILGVHSDLTSSGAGIRGETYSAAANAVGVYGQANNTTPGSQVAAIRGQNNGTNANGMGVYGIHNGGGAGVYGQSLSGSGIFGISNSGSSGNFSNTTVNNNAPTVNISTNGSGFALKANNTGTGDIALFQSASANKARIDKTGKGFFNGGTQTGGADVAEAFAVVGERSHYEAGDVLIIASGYRRTVEKCSKAYASNVIGVHATKPGVLLTERDVDANMDDLVPMGVVGVLPTKVCNEGGAISAGDLLVTSSRSGYAMKGDPAKVKVGNVLGKALEDFSGETGKIEVFVNVK